MTREQNIFETNSYNGGFLVDRETNLPVGFTSRGVDQNFVTASTDPVTGGIDLFVGKKRINNNRSPLSNVPAPTDDIPVVTYKFAGSVTANKLSSGDARISYFGGRVFEHNVFGMQSWNMSAEASGGKYSAYGFEFGTDSKILILRVYPTSARQTGWNMWVNGRKVFDITQDTTGVGGHYIKIEFTRKRAREISFFVNWGQAEIMLDSASSAWKLNRPLGRRLMCVGDSWGSPSGSSLKGWTRNLGLMLGYSDIHNSTEGGTGYVATNYVSGLDHRENYFTRTAQEVITSSPDDIVFMGSLNDLAVDPSLVYAAAKATYSAIHALLPNARVAVFGVQWMTSNEDSTRAAYDNAIKQACDESPNVSVFISTKGWLVGTGTVAAQSGGVLANTDVLRTADGNHMVLASQRFNSTAVALNDVLYTSDGVNAYLCYVAGTTGASEPTWPSVGGGVVDGTASLRNIGPLSDGYVYYARRMADALSAAGFSY